MAISELKISKWRILSATLGLIIMIIIFSFSSESGDNSSSTSGFFSEFAASLLINGYEDLSPAEQSESLSAIDHAIRKTAHFSIYAALGFFVSGAVGKRRVLSKASGISLLICFVYACSDELHQYFVPERSCAFTDVLIDTSGALTGILVSLLLMKIISKIKSTS